MKSFEQIQKEVTIWSKRNFGDQISKFHGGKLGQDAPIMGIAEELSEYREAGTIESKADAVADMGIFLCDAIGRASEEDGFDYSSNVMTEFVVFGDLEISKEPAIIDNVSYALGKLMALNLKRHQGIRKLSEFEFTDRKSDAFTMLISSIQLLSQVNNLDFNVILNETWETVSQRDWTKNSQTGV